MRWPSKRPLITAVSACTTPLQKPALRRMNFRHSIRRLSTVPSATSVSHDVSSPDNIISGPRNTLRARFLRRGAFISPAFLPINGHHLARIMESISDQDCLYSGQRSKRGTACLVTKFGKVDEPHCTPLRAQNSL